MEVEIIEDKYVKLGLFGNEEVFYDPETDIIHCKDRSIYYDTFKRFLEGDRIAKKLDDKTTIVSKVGTYKIGCLEDTKQNFDILHQKIKNIKELLNKSK